MDAFIIRHGGTGSFFPVFTYNNIDGGPESISNDDFIYELNKENKTWKIKFLTSGTLQFKKLGNAKKGIDIFVVGGGGGGASNTNASQFNGSNGGGGGGYTALDSKNDLKTSQSYSVVIGAGGGGGTEPGDGSLSSFGNVSASGGKAGEYIGYHSTEGGQDLYGGGKGGDGGSGGGGGTVANPQHINGGTDGADGDAGGGGSIPGGTGMRTQFPGIEYPVREFREAGGTIYSNGGSSSSEDGTAKDGAANTGNGGSNGGSGGSGIVIIRNKRS